MNLSYPTPQPIHQPRVSPAAILGKKGPVRSHNTPPSTRTQLLANSKRNYRKRKRRCQNRHIVSYLRRRRERKFAPLHLPFFPNDRGPEAQKKKRSLNIPAPPEGRALDLESTALPLRHAVLVYRIKGAFFLFLFSLFALGGCNRREKF